MATEKCILNCPRCGRVEGYLADEIPGILEADTLIAAETFTTDAGPATRLRCPTCGAWLEADRARQE
jgi:uncharacterized C2H2 Zn-finger protein